MCHCHHDAREDQFQHFYFHVFSAAAWLVVRISDAPARKQPPGGVQLLVTAVLDILTFVDDILC